MKRFLALSAVTAGVFFGVATGAPAKPTASCTEVAPGVTECTATRGKTTCTAVFVEEKLVSAECTKETGHKP
jgi:hypothetical protein